MKCPECSSREIVGKVSQSWQFLGVWACRSCGHEWPDKRDGVIPPTRRQET